MRSDNRATKLEDEWNEHGFVENLNLPAREEQLIWHVLEGASTLDIKKHFQRYLNEQNPEPFDERIIFMSVRRAIQTSVCTMPKKWQYLRQLSSQDTACVREDVVECRSQQTSRTMDGKVQMVDMFQVSQYTFRISSDRTTIAWEVEEIKNKLPLPRHNLRTRRFSSIPYWQATFCVFTTAFASGMISKILVLTPRRMEKEEQIDLDPEELVDVNCEKKHGRKPRARRTGSICQNCGN